jgi:hypothetical protein
VTEKAWTVAGVGVYVLYQCLKLACLLIVWALDR